MSDASLIADALARLDDRLEHLEEAVGALTAVGILHDPLVAAIEDLAIALRDAHGDAQYLPWGAAPESEQTTWRDMALLAWRRLGGLR